MFWWEGRTVAAHRLAYQQLSGPIRNDLELDHRCRRRACVRPDHLRVVDHWTNVSAGVNFTAVNAKKVCCPKGHQYSTKKRLGKVQRYCPKCESDRMKLRRAAARIARWALLWGESPAEPATK